MTRGLLCASPHLFSGPEAHDTLQIGPLLSGICQGEHRRLREDGGAVCQPSGRKVSGEFVSGRINFLLVCLLIEGEFFFLKGILS